MNKHRKGSSYVLWLGILFGLGGLHRLYNGKVTTGILWLCTGGLFGIGQIIDLFLIPRMVEAKEKQLLTDSNSSWNSFCDHSHTLPKSELMLESGQAMVDSSIAKLVKVAESTGGELSVTQGVIATGLKFIEVEDLLNELVKTDYVEIDNDPKTGTVIYRFRELASDTKSDSENLLLN
ncbi:TM2 domain-containing protein [Myxosarcina sp. GI1(2024)]